MKTILSIRFQNYPLWIINPDGTSTNLDVCEDDLINDDGSLDFETWIRENKDKYGITDILDENWIEFEMDDLYETGMGVDAYLWDNQYTYGEDY